MSGVLVRVLVRGGGGVVICRDFEVCCEMACLRSAQRTLRRTKQNALMTRS